MSTPDEFDLPPRVKAAFNRLRKEVEALGDEALPSLIRGFIVNFVAQRRNRTAVVTGVFLILESTMEGMRRAGCELGDLPADLKFVWHRFNREARAAAAAAAASHPERE